MHLNKKKRLSRTINRTNIEFPWNSTLLTGKNVLSADVTCGRQSIMEQVSTAIV